MPDTPYISLKLNGEIINLPQTKELPVSISYAIEDEINFQEKKAGTSIGIKIPATPRNSSKINTLFNPGAEDLLPNGGQNEPMDIIIIGSGNEVMKGKAFITAARKQFGKPKDADINCFGDNADWVIPLKETTLSETLSTTTHLFTKANIEASWLYDGTDETRDYVYAPNRNREPFGDLINGDAPDMIFRPENARPALSIYWMLWRGWKLAGYKVVSSFFDTDYFRRAVMPWTWGNFFYITDKLLKEMSFLATGPIADTGHGDGSSQGINGTGPAFSWWTLTEGGYTGSTTINDIAHYDAGDARLNWFLDNVTTDIGYIGNPFSYNYNPATGESAWEYLTAWSALGVVTAGFEYKLSASLDCSFNSNCSCNLDIFVNGTLVQNIPNLFAASAPTLGTDTDFGTRSFFFSVPNLSPGDIVSVKLNTHLFKSTFGFSFLKIISTGNQIALDPTNISIQEDVRSYWKLTYVKRQLGSTIEWQKYDKFKNYKWLDLLRGVTDAFNLQFNTDVNTKTVTIEPSHNYSLTSDLGAAINKGYYNGLALDWTQKEDQSKESEIKIFQDYEKQLEIMMQSDSNDGILKLMQDRHQSNLTQSRYIFPGRFKKGAKTIENRFFSGVVHYEHPQWKPIVGIAPQMICLIPENIANTSNPESEYTFSPKLAWYAGLVDAATYGGWNWDGMLNEDTFPYMFAVDYKPGGENNPIFTYCDQRINGVIGRGLTKRYFWQRFAIMRHGKILNASFYLKNTDVLNWLHREFKVVAGQRYQLLRIDGYKPLLEETTPCTLWKWYPITQADADNTFPSDTSVLTGVPNPGDDILYIQLLCLPTDIPQ